MKELEIEPEIIEAIIKGKAEAKKLGQETAFCFARISSQQQKEGVSLEHQVEQQSKYASENKLFILHQWSVVETAWKADKRPDFQKMLRLTERHGVTNLIFKDTDRALRNQFDQAQLENLCTKHQVKRHYTDSRRIIGPESHYSEQFMEGMLGLMAKFYSDQNAHKVKASFKEKAEKGIYPCKSPWGYQYSKEQGHVINVDTEPTLRAIFDGFDAEHWTIREYSEHLNKSGFRTQNGAKWSPGNLHRLISNVFYHGEFIHRDKVRQGKHETYYSKQRYSKRMERLTNRRSGIKSKKHKYPFTKFLVCADCGHTLTGEFQRGRHKRGSYVYYKHECGERNFELIYKTQQEITKLIDTEIERIRFSPAYAEALTELFDPVIDKKNKAYTKRNQYLSRKIERLTAEKMNIARFYARGTYTIEEVDKLVEEYDAQISILEKEQQSLRISDNDVTRTVCKLIKKLRDMPKTYLESQDLEGKADLLRMMAKHISIGENSAHVIWQEQYKTLMRKEFEILRNLVDTEQMERGSHLSHSAERAGFEPAVLSHTRFPSVHHRPLGHLSL